MFRLHPFISWMNEAQSSEDSAFIASFATSSHGRQDSQRSVLHSQASAEEDNEPRIRRPHNIVPLSNLSPLSGFQNRYSAFSVEKIPFDRDPVELARNLRTSLRDGLAESEAQTRLNLNGKNILKKQRRYTVWTVLWKQVSNAMTIVLLAALVIAFATKDYPEGSVIAGTLTLPLRLLMQSVRRR
jgi:magnesium-transporting ATPase (P-type)